MIARLLPLLAATLLCVSVAFGQSPSQWQQHVDYDMDIRLNTKTHRVDGHQRLTYTNNSRDTLHTVYYHLYFNAFHPNSLMATRNRQLPDPDGRIVPRIFNLEPDEQGWHKIESLTQNGTSVSYHVNDTVMRVDLADPILPGASTTFVMDYQSQVPLQTRRSGRDSRGDSIDYTMTQWYPKMAAYDERGWHANFYVNREYYAPYGEFDVEITLPAEYTIGATGVLQNPEEIGHGYAIEGDGIEGDGTWTPSDGLSGADSLTWHFTAEDVHNFAWSADPDYVHDKVVEDGTTHHILYKPNVAKQWRPLKNDMPELTAFFNEAYGTYAYPQMTVAQGGDGGMEYPMFTVVSSYDGPAFEEKSSYRSVLGTTVHEFAHMWYYAALGSNEADYAWMDEGFTTYATEEGMAHLMDRPADHTGDRRAVVLMHKMGLAEPFSTPADWFQTNLAYGISSYPGGAMLVDMMGYVIGDEQRDQWLHRYFREREGMHPDPFDLELFAEQESGLMLDWYFAQFTRTTRTVDDAIANLEQRRSGDGVEVKLTLEREGSLRLPQDVKLTLADGSTQWLNVPLASMHGHKPVPDDWIVTEPWPWVAPSTTVTVTVPSRVEKVVIDPNGETPDVNRLNNSTTLPLKTHFLRAPQSRWSHYELGVRPLAGYAHDFGFGGGVQVRGQYFRGERRLRATLTFWPEVLFSGGDDPKFEAFLGSPSDTDTGSWFAGLDYEFRYERPFHPFGARATVELSATKHLGVLENRLSFEAPLRSPLVDTSERLRFSLLQQLNPSDRAYGLVRTGPFVNNPWGESHAVSARFDYTIANEEDRLQVFAELGGTLRTADNAPSDQASRLGLVAQNTADFGLLTGQADFQFGLGANDLLPHKRFVLGGRSLERQWRNDAYRQISAGFEQPVVDAHLVGFGPAGPVAYLRAGRPGLTGENIVAGRLSLGDRPFPDVTGLSPLRLSVFSGLGTTWDEGAFLSGFDVDALVGDAGFGASYDVLQIPHLGRWIAQSDVLQGLKIVSKFPVWASDPVLIEGSTDEFDFRWLIGIEL